MMGKRYGVGSIKQIELGERGVSGRLKWIRIHGTADTVTIKKELPIRRALGGLPSAMFDLSVSGDAPRRTFTIRGAGRGHGVGLCQYGANGMAIKGYKYPQILHHYFTNVTIERVR
jgi:SpoIID/LytB domain protein